MDYGKFYWFNNFKPDVNIATPIEVDDLGKEMKRAVILESEMNIESKKMIVDEYVSEILQAKVCYISNQSKTKLIQSINQSGHYTINPYGRTFIIQVSIKDVGTYIFLTANIIRSNSKYNYTEKIIRNNLFAQLVYSKGDDYKEKLPELMSVYSFYGEDFKENMDSLILGLLEKELGYYC